MVRVVQLDHFVLRVADARRSCAWYREHFGFEVLRFEEWERGDAPFISLRINDMMIIDLVESVPDGTNVDHFCVVVDTDDLDAIAASGDFIVTAGPGDRFGARGIGRSFYVEDPDGNVVEIRSYESSKANKST